MAVAESHRMQMPPIELEISQRHPDRQRHGIERRGVDGGSGDRRSVAGARTGNRLRVLDEAARLEGHPDNVAACILGSIVASAIDSGGVARAVRLDLPQRFGVGIVVPDFDLPTATSRGGSAHLL